ncbi:pyruvate ferredoxin oxidoreductase [Candidatus Woesearchaeota archaeon]|nr:pyruvate ferredoxin oxidoreductase [Candidatus Woesearchaeota archaeon]
MKHEKPLPATGALAAATAMKQAKPDVVAAYPITPQTPIIEAFSKFVANGDVNTELILVESEHSAMSACVGASATGARVMTATAANGLALMSEIVFIAASLRLPIVMNIASRALSGPINIHCDHSDVMLVRDSGWIQVFVENPQEVYDYNLIALKIAENMKIPAMVIQDGFITSHCLEPVRFLPQQVVDNFLGVYNPGNHSLLNPITFGPLDLYDYYFEHKRQQLQALEDSKQVIKQVLKEYNNLAGTNYNIFETYKLEDAELGVVVAGSTAGTLKHVVNVLRDKGVKAGLLKLGFFRPFFQEELKQALKHLKAIAILDRSASFGAFGSAFYNEIKSALYDLPGEKPKVLGYIYGLGGRDFLIQHGFEIFNELQKIATGAEPVFRVRCIGVREG